MKNKIALIVLLFLFQNHLFAQNYTFNFNSSGRRVCLVSSEVDLNANTVKIIFHDSLSNSNEPLYVSRRVLGTFAWTPVASALPAGTGHWIDNNVAAGDIWEYQVKRQDTWNYQNVSYDATGYTIGCLQVDNANYKGQMILLTAADVSTNLATEYAQLKRDITADGWFINELIVPRANNWDSGSEVVTIKNQITDIYNNASADDKPQALFILGHVPLPRSGATSVVAPDEHDENKGARGCDAYYADIDGVYTDTATYNPGGLATNLAINLVGDFKWDQDFFPSDVEMGFGRIDFADLTDVSISELTLLQNYMNRLSNYKNIAAGFDMGDKSAFYFGYDNSNDGSYRSLPNISKPTNFYQNYNGPSHNQWVQNNGPFKVYMQNLSIPEMSDWQTYGMNATVYASDQSYWGFGDVPQPSGVNSRIRALLAAESKCLVTLWTTTGINMFHQACTGRPVGIAMKEIMNHNPINQYLEKPSQEYDTPNWWNRTHFAFYGDPTLNLYQIATPSNITIAENNDNKAYLQWTNSADPDIIGYHIYVSNTELGKYERITTSPIDASTFVLENYELGNWYMVKAVKSITSGCGVFLHSSLGKTIQGDITLSSVKQVVSNINIHPNPSNDFIQIESDIAIKSIELYNTLGEKVLEMNLSYTKQPIEVAHLNAGIYLVQLRGIDNVMYSSKLIISK